VPTLTITRTLPLIPRGFFVQWTLDVGAADPVFRVERSGSREGPWELVAADLTNRFAHLDDFTAPVPATTADVRRPNHLALQRTFFYRVTATLGDGSTATAVADTGPQVTGKMAQLWRHTVHDTERGLRLLNQPVAVLKRRRWGARCPKCVDKVTQAATRTQCLTCFGTKFVGGFWTPVRVFGRRDAPQQNTVQTAEGASDGHVTTFCLPRLPPVEKGDVLVCFRDLKRFLVVRQQETQVSQQAAYQNVYATEIDHADILFNVVVDVTAVAPLY